MVRKNEMKEDLGNYTKIIVETDENDPVTIATIQLNKVEVADGYRVRFTPKYD